jgi:hydroxyacylglutathione hydrolase
MLLKRFYDEKLAHASWLLGCNATGEALVIDPNRDAAQYVEAAAREGVRVTHVAETHIHADFVSGSRELAARTGARLHLSDEGGDDWRYAFAAEDGAVPLKDGASFRVGNVRVDVMHTPGHTPEHLSFVVTDTATGDAPVGVFTGDFVFVGDVGRPDLLERAAQYAGTMESGARTLFASLQRFKDALPDYVQLWPAHGAGSACGKALGAMPSTTLGYERLFNWALAEKDEAAFVRAVLAGQPEPPMYFAQMKRINRDGPAVLGEIHLPPRIAPDRLPALLAEGATVIDLRPGSAYAARHAPGTLSVAMGKSFSTFAGSVIPYDRPLYLLVDANADAPTTPDALRTAVRDLAMIGLDDVAGWIALDAIDAAGTVPEWSADQVDAARVTGEAEVIDVRNSSEFEAGHLPGAHSFPLGRLAERVGDVPRGKTLVVHCQAGSRAWPAVGLLRAHGFPVVHLAGDYAAWKAAGRPVELGAAVPA